MQRLEVSDAVRLICKSLGVKGLRSFCWNYMNSSLSCRQDIAAGLDLTQHFKALSLNFSNICFGINVLSASSSCKCSSPVTYNETVQTSVIHCIRY